MQKDVYAINYLAPQPTQEEEDQSIPTPGLPQQQYEPFGPIREPKSHPSLSLQTILEDITKLLVRQIFRILSFFGSRLIGFRGDLARLSEPQICLIYLLSLRGKEKKAITSNQLENAREKKLGKSKATKLIGNSKFNML